MNIEEMFDKIWWKYPNDLCKGKKGGKAPALKALKRINPDEQEFNRIMGNLDAQIRHDRQDKDAYRWPFLSSYLNQQRYDDEIPSSTINREVQELGTCSVDGCSDFVHHVGGRFCAFHIPSQHDERLRQAWTRTGLSIKDPDFAQKARDYCKERMKVFLS